MHVCFWHFASQNLAAIGVKAYIDWHGRSLYRSRSYNSPLEDIAVAETTKLSVGQALEKLRGTDAPTAKMARLDEKIDTLPEETKRLRAMRHRLERDQRAGSTGRDAQGAVATRGTKLKILGLIIGIVIVIPILAWKWGPF